MKKITLVLLWCSTIGAVKAQYAYQPFIDSNKVWKYFEHCVVPMSGTYIAYRTIQLNGDTNISGLEYKKLGGDAFVREDSSKKVYFFGTNNIDTTSATNGRLLYDFSLAVGDTMFSEPAMFIVDSVDTIMSYNTPRRVLYLQYIYYFNNRGPDVWIEGVGSWFGPLGKLKEYFMLCPESHLCSVETNNTAIFHSSFVGFSGACDNPPLGFDETETHPLVSIFPNPANTFFNLQFSFSPIASTHFLLFDALGREVKQQEINAPTTTLSCGNLPNGIYFWQMQQAGKIVHRGKLVVE